MKKFVSFCLVLSLMCLSFTHAYGNTGQENYWTFEEGSGNTTIDQWGSYDGTLDNAQWTQRDNQGAMSFANGYVILNGQELATPWTLGVWVNYDNSQTNNATIISSDNYAIKVEQWDNTNLVGFTHYGHHDYSFNYSLPDNEWTHLTFVGTNSGIDLYVNGVYKDTKDVSIPCPRAYIGKGKDGASHMRGEMDELKIFSKALTASEIAALENFPEPDYLSRASRVLIDKGLQVQAWITTDETGRYDVIPADWDALNFTAPTYYEAPMYNSDLHDALPNSQWSLAKAPYYNQLTTPPPNSDHFLSQEQRDNLSNLVSMCFGDEEGYSTSQVNALKGWYDLSRDLYPEALVHSNQWLGQWNKTQLRYYMQTAKPDILTFDKYYFDETPSPGYERSRDVANSLDAYRELALEGYDGSGDSPIAFGQYLLGYLTGPGQHTVGTYRISQSQINMVPFTTVTMGGKWLNMFRWLQESQYGLMYDGNGNKTDSYYHHQEMAKEIGNLSPHLTRLKSTVVSGIAGQHKEGGNTVTNNLTYAAQPWTPSTDDFFSNIIVENIGTVNDGLAGDVLIGYFEPLKGLTPEMTNGIFTSDTPEYFMIMNTLINGDGINAPESALGSCDDSKQKITFTVSLGSRLPDSLKRVDRTTGAVETVTLTHVSGSDYTFTIELGGGKGDLFYWE